MKTSDKIDLISAALVKAQATIEEAAKDSRGNYGKYATLASVVDACKPHLVANGIAFVQTFEPAENGRMCLTTTLLHSSGQYISGTCSMPLPKQDPQGYGSAATYARRYGLAAIVGVCPEDDDGQGAMPKAQDRRQQPQQQRPTGQQSQPPDDLADDSKFAAILDELLETRGFDAAAATTVKAKAAQSKRAATVFKLSLGDRHALLDAVNRGAFDKLKGLAA